ncbi:MAG: (d)CMP kinase [Dehalococcoidia bacterium]
MPLTIAIDGPVASGKTAVGAALARRLGALFLDTGQMYRAVTLQALRGGVDLDDAAALGKLARTCGLEVVPAEEGTRILVDGEDVTGLLRSAEVDAAVSRVSSVPAVREVMVALQREIARERPVVMVGRDIGTVVLPEADLKVYLDAEVEERARRRWEENHDGGDERTVEEIAEALRERDRVDSSRNVSPLVAAEGAQTIKTDGMSIEDVVEAVAGLVVRG